jgi:hypothetical protein
LYDSLNTDVAGINLSLAEAAEKIKIINTGEQFLCIRLAFITGSDKLIALNIANPIHCFSIV